MPRVGGLGRVVREANRLFLSLGAPPLVTASMHNHTKLRLDLRSNTEASSFYLGEYDAELIAACKQLYDPETVFLDVGANIGFYSTAMGSFVKSAGAQGRLLSFEPHPGNFGRLLSNLSLNNLESVVSCFQLALSDAPGTMDLVLREDFAQGSGTGNASIATNKAFDRGFTTVEISAIPLDQFIDQEQLIGAKIGFIKVDIEGHEDSFLTGARDTIRTHEPVLLLEINKPFYEAREVLLDERLLGQLPSNYSVFRLLNRSMRQISSLNQCDALDNVFALPESKLRLLRSNTKGISWD